ncbi:hypothetical protein PSPO_b0703 [Pseudoalteromonas spongiae UST010723-006]|nr:hypothetical protein PSPO_b0703 [Pseudoalteromonas spongiae UST010723-006]
MGCPEISFVQGSDFWRFIYTNSFNYKRCIEAIIVLTAVNFVDVE